ncbi:hypothetical protein ACFRCQ_07610 [Cytobacillus firmus]|uniref:hypothetical protein n=1 Tax=Cytobacillus firmus TaxID=1399 RepID=UPI0036ACA990
MKTHLKDRLLRQAIEAHIRIINEGEHVDLSSIGFEEGTPHDRVYTYNAFMILSKLEFPKNVATNPSSAATRFLNEAVKNESNVEAIIEKLLEYREQVK